MWLLTLLDSYEKNKKEISLLASQKIVVANLMSYLEQMKFDENIQRTINELKPLKEFYESLEVEKGEATEENQQPTDGKIVVGGNTKIKMSEEQV